MIGRSQEPGPVVRPVKIAVMADLGTAVPLSGACCKCGVARVNRRAP
jgi:hypothetical protein